MTITGGGGPGLIIWVMRGEFTNATIVAGAAIAAAVMTESRRSARHSPTGPHLSRPLRGGRPRGCSRHPVLASAGVPMALIVSHWLPPDDGRTG